jgi:hypothetical protein
MYTDYFKRGHIVSIQQTIPTAFTVKPIQEIFTTPGVHESCESGTFSSPGFRQDLQFLHIDITQYS